MLIVCPGETRQYWVFSEMPRYWEGISNVKNVKSLIVREEHCPYSFFED